MTGPDEAERLTRVRALRSDSEGMITPFCLDDETLAALAEGGLQPDIRSACLSHLAGCGRCRRAVASVARALANPEVAGEIRSIERAGRPPVRRFVPIALGVAAAAAIILFAWLPRLEDPAPPHRASPITAAPAPEAVGPVGPVSEAQSLRWTPVSGADRYRVTLFDANGSVIYEAELTGTSLALPDSVQLFPGRTYGWKVDARLGFDRWAGSQLIQFSITQGPGR
jgi:hypothetical protein